MWMAELDDGRIAVEDQKLSQRQMRWRRFAAR